MKSRLALDSLRYVDGQFHAVIAESAGRCRSVDGGTTVATQDTAMGVSGVGNRLFKSAWSNNVRCAALLGRCHDGHRLIIYFHRHLDVCY